MSRPLNVFSNRRATFREGLWLQTRPMSCIAAIFQQIHRTYNVCGIDLFVLALRP